MSHLDLLADALAASGEGTTVPTSFSDLRVPARLRRIDRASGELVIAPGEVRWWIASPDNDFLTRLSVRFAPGVLLPIGAATLAVRDAATYAFPRFGDGIAEPVSLRFSCHTPLVAGNGSRPADAYAPIVRQMLLDTFARVQGRAPVSDTVGFAWDAGYLQSHPRSGTKRILWRGETVDGILAPFVLTASPELLRVAWECGVGGRTGDGFGFAEIAAA